MGVGAKRALGLYRSCAPRQLFDVSKAHAETLSKSHPQPLAERYVNLSTHTAPIRRTHLSSRGASEQTDQGDACTRSARVGFNKTVSLHHLLLRYVKWFCLHPHLLLVNPVECEQDRLTSPLRSITITVTSSLIRATPSQCLASVLRFLWVLHLNGSLCIKTTGSRSSIEKPESDSRHLHAGHRLGGIQDNPQTYPGDTTHLRFRCHVLVHDESAVVHLRSSF